MVRLINRDTGGVTWVHESRLEEYLAAGHKLPAPPEAPATAPKAPRKPKAKK